MSRQTMEELAIAEKRAASAEKVCMSTAALDFRSPSR
jgi:hypothetical protein